MVLIGKDTWNKRHDVGIHGQREAPVATVRSHYACLEQLDIFIQQCIHCHSIYKLSILQISLLTDIDLELQHVIDPSTFRGRGSPFLLVEQEVGVLSRTTIHGRQLLKITDKHHPDTTKWAIGFGMPKSAHRVQRFNQQSVGHRNLVQNYQAGVCNFWNICTRQ